MKDYIVQEMITLCYSYKVCAVNEGAAIAKIRDGGEVLAPKRDASVDISYAARDAHVFLRRSPKFQIEICEPEPEIVYGR